MRLLSRMRVWLVRVPAEVYLDWMGVRGGLV
jgi:hypothetical protein